MCIKRILFKLLDPGINTTLQATDIPCKLSRFLISQ
jgi:hypothetical protein